MTRTKLKKLSFWGVTKKTDGSWNWRNLLNLSIAKSMFTYRFGDGKKFSFWFDPWCNCCSIMDIFPEINFRESFISKDAIVFEFWRNGGWVLLVRWDVAMTRIGSFLDG